jgi:hypothetical protein
MLPVPARAIERLDFLSMILRFYQVGAGCDCIFEDVIHTNSSHFLQPCQILEPFVTLLLHTTKHLHPYSSFSQPNQPITFSALRCPSLCHPTVSLRSHLFGSYCICIYIVRRKRQDEYSPFPPPGSPHSRKKLLSYQVLPRTALFPRLRIPAGQSSKFGNLGTFPTYYLPAHLAPSFSPSPILV